ncbi:MAG: HAD-IA family hydrolase [Prosthecobacter sp.]|nr:HAD-IA family hydrolase [Prosthecobacter sp.]
MPRPALLCDIGNVLVSFDFSIAARRLAELCPFPLDSLLTRLEGIKEPFEAGEMDDAAFVQAATAAMEFRGTGREFEEIWCAIFAENAAMEASLSGLASRAPMFLLSNTSGLHKDYLLRSFPIFRHFQDGVYSYSARSSKPEEGIFRQAIERFDLDPALTFYVDDLEANITTARRLGFDAHLYDLGRHGEFERALAAWRARHEAGEVTG